ncbi:hypothetical protein [Streptomyces erythrochromogenes]|uniref:hypothetical protein n=1 Tax=Streptomyces erythrochromogenes TaxID=285574 RepID=UPI0036B00ABA
MELHGGPADGQLLDVTGWSLEELAGGALLATSTGVRGPGGRWDYVPARRPVHWDGDTP